MSERLDEVADYVRPGWRNRPQENEGFGGIGLVCVGDFGQAPPICDEALIRHPDDNSSTVKGTDAVRRVAFARRLIAKLDTVFRFRRVHRQGAVCPFKESALGSFLFSASGADVEFGPRCLFGASARPTQWFDTCSRCSGKLD